MKHFLFAVIFWCFIVLKIWGTAVAAWSWWWVLLPLVPMVWLGLQRSGLL